MAGEEAVVYQGDAVGGGWGQVAPAGASGAGGAPGVQGAVTDDAGPDGFGLGFSEDMSGRSFRLFADHEVAAREEEGNPCHRGRTGALVDPASR